MPIFSAVHDLTSTVGIIAIAAAAVGVVALLTTLILALRLRKVRAEQRAVLGDRREDLVTHAAGLAAQFEALHSYVEDLGAHLDHRVGSVEQRLDGAVSHVALVRYDAYNEMSGHQSVSIALLDSSHSGVVLSSIHHRDSARMYAKQITAGRGQQELSPEENQAIKTAISGGGVPQPPPAEGGRAASPAH